MKNVRVCCYLMVVSLSFSSLALAAAETCLRLQSDHPDVTLHKMAEALTKHTPVSGAADCVIAQRGLLTVSLRVDQRALAITYETKTGKSTTRIVEPAPTSSETLRLAASLAYSIMQEAEASSSIGAAPEPSQPAALPAAPTQNAPQTQWVNLSLFYPLATNMKQPNVLTHLSVNLLYGHVGTVEGVQLGLVSAISKELHGLQISLLANLSKGKTEGWQVAPLNVAGDAMQGVQTGLVNLHSKNTFEGVQVGAVNVAQELTGLQLGVVNVAHKINGFSLGLVNLSDDGGIHPTVFTSSDMLLNVGVKFATKYLYTGALFANNPAKNGVNKNSLNLVSVGFIFGGKLTVASWLRIDADLGVTQFWGNDPNDRNNWGNPTSLWGIQYKARVMTVLSVAPHLSLLLGGGTSSEGYRDRPDRVSIQPELFAGFEF